MIYIYSLHLAGQCIYVGQTALPGMREAHHRRRWAGSRMELIAECDEAHANDVEAALIMLYRSRGEPLANQHERATRMPGHRPVARARWEWVSHTGPVVTIGTQMIDGRVVASRPGYLLMEGPR